MTKWWYCGNIDCDQFEHVASADYPPACPHCGDAMIFIEENELDDVNLPKVSNDRGEPPNLRLPPHARVLREVYTYPPDSGAAERVRRLWEQAGGR